MLNRFTGGFVLLSGALLVAFFGAAPAQAQEENVPEVVDEVIAQVNNDVVTLSMLKRTMREAQDALKQQRNLSDQQATDEVTKRQPEIIATLINEQLLLQKGKDLGLTDQVEAQVNKQMLDVANQQGIKTMEALDTEMKKGGLDPSAIRQTMRIEIMKNAVLSKEVDAKIFYGLTNEEVKKYYAAHQEKFQKPETVTLSEIFLSLAGKSEAEVRAKAQDLAKQARGGADFGQLAATNSEREENGVRVAVTTKGKIGTYQMPDITKVEVAAALKNLKPGELTDPIKTDEGYIILRVDERTAPSGPSFDDSHVREAMTYERADKAREDYLAGLRKEAYIKVAPDYKAAVLPILKVSDSDVAKTSSPDTATASAAPPKHRSRLKSLVP